ncbi:hypothetical protein G3H63_11580 [Microbacterium resistens]|nr:hypothetical protein [Microbacterium resistens]
MTAETQREAPRKAPSLAFAPHLNGHHDAEHDLRRAVERRTTEAVEAGRRALDGISDAEGLLALQQRVRAVVHDALGRPMPLGPVPHTVHGGFDLPGMRVERIAYAPRPRAHVPATLYTPSRLSAPTGAVLLACGHTDAAKADPEYQLLARALCRAGLVVLVPDPIGQGERHSYPPGEAPAVGWGTREHTYAGVQSWWHGFSPARFFIEDARAGISVLQGLDAVDPGRVGATGHSGGGSLVTLLCAVEDRLAAAAPATFVTARDVSIVSGQAQDAEQIVRGGLAHGVDHAQLLLAMAPRPVLVLAAAYDFFPLAGTLDTVRRMDEVRERVGMPPVELAVADEGHAYSAALRARAVEFFRRVLADEQAPPAAAEDTRPPARETPATAADLAVYPDGVRAAHPDEPMIFERTLQDAGRGAGPRRVADAESARDWLRHAVLAAGDPAPARMPRWFPGIRCRGGIARQGFWLTDRGIHTSAVLFAPDEATDRLRVVVGVPTDGLDGDAEVLDGDGAATLVLDVRGTGAVRAVGRAPARGDDIIGPDYTLLCDLLSLGDALEAARVRDLLHAVVGAADGLLPTGRYTRLTLVGRGARRFTAAVAAAICGPAVGLDLDERPAPEQEARTRAWDASAGRWQWVLPGYASAVGDRLLERLNDPGVGGEHRDLALLRTVRDALAAPALARIRHGDGGQQ